jgi:hypothetical protein
VVTALAQLSAKRLQLALEGSDRAEGRESYPGKERFGDNGVRGVEEVLSALRQVERGILQAPIRREFCINFERTPVWLLALEANVVDHLWILGLVDASSFYAALEAAGTDSALFRAAVNNITSERVSYAIDLTLKPDTIVLASGSFDYVRQLTTAASNPTLVLCENRIRSLPLCIKQLRRSGKFSHNSREFRWLSLRHHTFGGVTKFESMGTNIPAFEPVRTTLRCTIWHVIDYGIKPSWANPSKDTNSMLSLDDRLHPDQLSQPVLCPTHYSATGWGSRPLL